MTNIPETDRGADPRPTDLRLGRATISGTPETIEAVRRQIAEHLATTVRLQGARALESPLSSVKYHEAGHAVVYTHLGREVKRCKIWQRKRGITRGHWVGETFVDQKWKVDETTPPLEDFHNACCILAGVLAERLFDEDNFRLGSSADEVVLVYGLVAQISMKTGHPPTDVMNRVISVGDEILTRNAEVVHEIASELEQHKAVRGARLRSLLERVLQRRTTH